MIFSITKHLSKWHYKKSEGTFSLQENVCFAKHVEKFFVFEKIEVGELKNVDFCYHLY